jgi:hypothetical protein
MSGQCGAGHGARTHGTGNAMTSKTSSCVLDGPNTQSKSKLRGLSVLSEGKT